MHAAMTRGSNEMSVCRSMLQVLKQASEGLRCNLCSDDPNDTVQRPPVRLLPLLQWVRMQIQHMPADIWDSDLLVLLPRECSGTNSGG